MKEVIVVPRRLTKTERDQGRTVLARKALWDLLAAARTQVDSVTWIKEGCVDAEEFLECLDDGRWHPLLEQWHKRKATVAANRPAPTAREKHARRLMVLAVIAVERVTSVSKQEARKMVAAAAADVFESAPTERTIEHWRKDQPSPTQPDERVMANAIACSKLSEPDGIKHLIGYFIGLAHAVMTPGATLAVET
jgi:hypothetical protein